MKKLKFPKISEKMKRRFLAGAFAVMTIFVSVMAYLTSTERTTNRFTIGDIKIDLVEPSFPGNADPTNVKTNHRTVNGDKWESYVSGSWQSAGGEPNGAVKLNDDTVYVVNQSGEQINTDYKHGGSAGDIHYGIKNGVGNWYGKNTDDKYYPISETNGEIDTTQLGLAESDFDVNSFWAVDSDLSKVGGNGDDRATHFTASGGTVTFFKKTEGGDSVNTKDISYADANYILPGELIPKDPKIVNTGKNEAIVFMKVEVPTYTDVTGVTREVFAFNLTGANITNGVYATSPALTKFSELDSDTELPGNWIYLGKADDTDLGTSVNGNAQNNLHTYIFGYKTILNPEAPNEKINDGVNKITGADHTPTDYETTNLFKYVVLNPDLNGVDPYEGNKFYQVTTDSTSGQITKAEPVLQDIKIHAYGVQANFLRDNGNDITTGNNMSKDTLTKIWTVAGFGNIVNDTIPPADGHNKYGIPNDQRDENYTNPKNPWTNATGTPISLGKKNVLTREITYEVGNNSKTYKYYKVDGSTDNWVGAWYPYENGITCTEFDADTFQAYLDGLDVGTATVTGTGDTPNFVDDNIAATYKTVIFEGATTLSFVNIGNTGWKCITTDSAGNVLTNIPEGTWSYNGSGSYTTMNDILTALNNNLLGSEGTVTLTKS